MIRRLALVLAAALVLVAPASAQDSVEERLERLEALFHHDIYQGGGIRLLGQTDGTTIVRQPLIDWMVNGKRAWQMGLDSHTAPLEDLVIAVRGRDDFGPGVVEDVIYLRDWNGLVATGFSITPPLPGYRVQIGSPDRTQWGALMLRVGAHNTGDALYVRNSAGARLFAIDHLGRLVPREGGALPVMGDIRVRSSDAAEPAAIHLNANPGDIGSDFSLRNVYAGGAYQFQLLTRGESVLSVRGDSGEVAIPSGRIRAGDGVLYESDGELRWRVGNEETVLAPRVEVPLERIEALEGALAHASARLDTVAALEEALARVGARADTLEAELARQRTDFATDLAQQRTDFATDLAQQRTDFAMELAQEQSEFVAAQARLERRDRALARCVARRATSARVACAERWLSGN